MGGRRHLSISTFVILLRLRALETKIFADKGAEPKGLSDLKKKVEEFKEKLEVSSVFFLKPFVHVHG